MDSPFFGLAVIGAFVLWLLTAFPPLLGGVVMLSRSQRMPSWPPETVRLVATLILKPVVTTAVYVALYLFLSLDSVPLRALPVLAILGPGVTGLIVWRFRDAARLLPRTALVLLLVLDLMRWLSSFLATARLMPSLAAYAMPTLAMVVGWLLIARGRFAVDQAGRWDPHRLLSALLTAGLGLVILLVLPWALGVGVSTSIERQSAGQRLQALNGKDIFPISWSPDGALLAASGRPGAVYVVSPAQDAVQFTYDTPSARVDNVLWSPRGDVIAVQLPIAIQLIDARDGHELRTVKFFDEPYIKAPDVVIPSYNLADPVWSPDGRWLAIDTGSRYTVLLDPFDAQADRTLRQNVSIVTFAWSPDSRYLAIGAAGDDSADITIWDVATGTMAGQLATGDLLQVLWSPDGAWIAVHGWYDRGVLLYDATTLQRQALPIDQLDGIAYKAWSPDGKLLAIEHKDGTIEIWEPTGAAPLQRFPAVVHHASIRQPTWSHDGRWLAAADREGVWVWDSRRGTQQSLSLPGFAGPPTWHPTQPWFAVVSQSGVRLIKLEP